MGMEDNTPSQAADVLAHTCGVPIWGGRATVWVENFEAINFRCFRGVSLDPQNTNFDLAVQLLSHGAFQVLQACYPATMTGEFSPRPPRFR
jgi:hypothetical protein